MPRRSDGRIDVTSPAWTHGVDISITEEMEHLGVTYRDRDGAPCDLVTLAARAGSNLVRLRLWVDPYDADGAPYLGGTNDLARTLRLARRAHEAGMAVQLDLHYSDFWADPAKQRTPKAWAGLGATALAARVGEYTRTTLDAFAAAGLPLASVQVGNEITNGTCWPVAATARYDDQTLRYAPADPAADDALAGLLRAGTAAVREHSDAEVVLHLDQGGSDVVARQWLDRMLPRGVELDILGLSYYPFWHGSLADLGANLDHLATTYGLDLLVAETAFARSSTTPAGHGSMVRDAEIARTGREPGPDSQAAFLTDLDDVVAATPGDHGRGVIYWEPAWLPVDGSSWASPAGMAYAEEGDADHAGVQWSNLALVDESGHEESAWRTWTSHVPDPARGAALRAATVTN